MSPFVLKDVTEESADVMLPQVLTMIKELAAYEKEPDAVVATIDLLRDAFFGAQDDGPAKGERYTRGILAYPDDAESGLGEPVGMAIYFFTFSTWTGRGGLYLEDLFVKESARGQGVGKALFKRLGQICRERQLPRMDWVVLDWNEPAKQVYRKMGAVHKKEWEGMRLEGDALRRLAED